jgi:uncharacterized protein YciI
MKLDAYTVTILRRPPNAPSMSDDQLEALQERHLAYRAHLRELGHILVNGPIRNPLDESIRGMSIFRTSVDEARRLSEMDPSVIAGRLVVDVFTWLVPAGHLGDDPAARIEES